MAGEKILIVDDSEVNRLIADSLLVQASYVTAQANNGREALEMLLPADDSSDEGCPYDAVLLDVMMPEIDGLEVLRRLRERWNTTQLPVIMATAKDSADDIVEAFDLGANDYVVKPLDKRVLQARLRTHLEVRRSHEALRKAQHSLLNAARMESVGILAAGVAHEIRNPLGQIQMAASGLLGLLDGVPTRDREMGEFALSTITEAVTKADGIVQQLMLSSQSQQLDLEPAALNEIVRKRLSERDEELAAAGIRLRFDLAENLPCVMVADEEFIQAFDAVVTNAIQVMLRERVAEAELTFTTEETVLSGLGSQEGGRSGNRPRDGDRVVALHIGDSGPGLSKEHLDKVFDPFFTTKATGVGTGLGLTVARKIIELHHGLMRVENRPSPSQGLRVSFFVKTEKTMRTSV